MKIERLLGILFYILNRERVSGAILADKFGVSRRTILRDIDTIIPDCSLDEINEDEMVAILLPGADRWIANYQKLIVGKLTSYIDKGILVAAICGATIALSDLRILNNHLHTTIEAWYKYYLTGNSKYYLELLSSI